MEKKTKKFNPKPKNEFEKGLFHHFEKACFLEKDNQNQYEKRKKESVKRELR